MSDGKTHEKYLRHGWKVAIPLGIALSILLKNVLYIPLIYINFWVCDVLDPDADQLGWTKSEGDFARITKKFKIGFVGIIWFSWWSIYAYIVGMFGGHRSRTSHSLPWGTIGRMIWFNIPPFVLLFFIGSYGISHWWTTHQNWFSGVYWNLYLDVWLIPYFLSQFASWTVGDAIHLWLDFGNIKRIFTGK